MGKLERELRINKGVFQGGRPVGYLFIIYAGATAEGYDNDIKPENKDNVKNTTIRNGTGENERPNYLHLRGYSERR